LFRRLLPLIPTDLSVVQVLPTPDCATIVTHSTVAQSACPRCGILSDHVHSHDTRSPADLPCRGRIATVQLQARRFRCAITGCPRRIFTKRLPEVVHWRAGVSASLRFSASLA